ncbi:LysE family transporter [Streptomyces sp. NPDC126514]|uniref:LysE family translocator n=1 Tax=Streptomyces sp. NPDC126514 TaxID=3155210 RepID=UPI00332353FB
MPRPSRRLLMMVDLAVLPTYIAVILLFLAPPGPDMAYMVAVGLEGGRASAVRAILGIGTGMCVYAAAVVAGMGEIARSHPSVLDSVRMLGAAYLQIIQKFRWPCSVRSTS